jgi:hypothetical protein
VLIAVGAVGQSPYRIQQIDPHGDSVHMGHKNRMEPAVSDKLRRGRVSLAVSFTQKVSFGSSYDGTVVCTENLIRVDDVMESPKLAE